MSSSCGTCSGSITKGRYPGIKCGGVCEKLYHIKCANISVDLIKSIRDRSVNWLCESCREASNQSLIVCDDVSDSESVVSLNDIMSQLKKMDRRLSAFEELKGIVVKLQSDNSLLMCKVQKLEEQLRLNTTKLYLSDAVNDKPNQVTNNSSITISGLPMMHGDAHGMIVSVISKLDIVIGPNDIVSVEKVQRNIPTTQVSQTSHRIKSKTNNSVLQYFFIVKLISTDLKNKILDQMRKKKTLHTNDLDGFLPQNHPAQRIFVMQHFTKFQTQLYREAKIIKMKFNYKYLWVKSGQIYLRKTADADVHRIHSMNDIFLLQCNDHPVDENRGPREATEDPGN